MAYSIDDIAAIAGQAAQAKARNIGLEEQFARAQVLRDEARPDRIENPLAQLARFTRNSRGQKQARELRPGLDANRLAMGQGDVAGKIYGLERAKAAVDQKQDNFESTAEAQVLKAAVAAEALKRQQDRTYGAGRTDAAQRQSNWGATFGESKRRYDATAAAKVEAAGLEAVNEGLEDSAKPEMKAAELKNLRLTNVALAKLPGIIEKVKKTPGAFGNFSAVEEYLPDVNVFQEAGRNLSKKQFYPDEKKSRAAVFETGYQVVKEMAGTAVSGAEKNAIRQFLPGPNDAYEDILLKMEQALELAQGKRQSFEDLYDMTGISSREEQKQPPTKKGRAGQAGWRRLKDANGNEAWVGPNDEIEEIN